ncbi:9126_t:CDS:2 [Ambispora gerdemannii]|uniref:9126_t:CDS:1 n=1 Tax=Ambispora gerdemannii TaxID=144530 RepID=A0A9N9EKE0_9GLOM|nr:9126_t:CDS:2 [Ambispora gerdemannii]
MKTHSAQVIWYGSGKSDDYSSDSDKYSDNISECESENCSDYGSDYESDIETSTIKSPVFHPPKRQEKFDNKFTQMDLLNRICEIASSPARDMSNNKGISLLDAYTREELTNKLVIQMEQDEYRKFSVVDDISEVYDLSEIHKSISGELSLRAVIDIDAS